MRRLERWLYSITQVRNPQRSSLDERTFLAAVKLALRDFNRPDHLRTNPLLDSCLVSRHPDKSAGQPSSHVLRSLIRDSATEIGRNPKYRRFQQVLQVTYFDPQRRQRAAADALYLSWGSYRRYLREARELLAVTLWDAECNQRVVISPQPLLTRIALRGARLATPAALILALLTIGQPYPADTGQLAKPGPAFTFVVLPFSEISQHINDISFGKALTRNIITQLGQIHGIHVIDADLVHVKTSRAVNPQAIEQPLRVNGVVQGNVEHLGDFLRVDVELVRATDGEECWSDQITMRQQALFKLEDTLQHELAVELAHAIRNRSIPGCE